MAFLLGTANAFDAPARLALAPELVDKQDLTNAIALNATMFNTATVLGPTIGGLIYAAFGHFGAEARKASSTMTTVAAKVATFQRKGRAANQPRTLDELK